MIAGALAIFAGIILVTVGLADGQALAQLMLVASLGWLFTITAAALEGKEFASMTKAATMFACVKIGAGAIGKLVETIAGRF